MADGSHRGFGGTDRQPARLRRAIAWVLLAMLGAALGVAAVYAWRYGWLENWNWTAALALAIFANAVIALMPLWREERRRNRQAQLLRFRLWIHFSKLRWLLAHLNEQDPTRGFLAPGLGGEELHGIEVLLAQAHILEIDEYEWVLFTVNAALPFFGQPIRDLGSHAVRLLWTVDATLAQLNRQAATRQPAAE
jgi:hypothetical protein